MNSASMASIVAGSETGTGMAAAPGGDPLRVSDPERLGRIGRVDVESVTLSGTR